MSDKPETPSSQMPTGFIDPPGPFSPVEELRRFLKSLDALPENRRNSPQVCDARAEVQGYLDEHLAALKFPRYVAIRKASIVGADENLDGNILVQVDERTYRKPTGEDLVKLNEMFPGFVNHFHLDNE